MYQRIFSTTVALSFILLVVASCDKKDPLPPPQPEMKVKKIANAGADEYNEFEYNSSGLLTKWVAQWIGQGVTRQTHVIEYNGDKAVKTSNEAGYLNFIYTGNKVSKADAFVNSGRKISTWLLTYNSAGQLITLIEQINEPRAGDPVETKVAYEYYSNGNLSKMHFGYRNNVNDPFTVYSSKVFVSYDNKKNAEPAAVLGFHIPGIKFYVNNPVKIENRQSNGTVDGYSRFEYTYNTAGYPLQKKHFIATGTAEQAPLTFNYTYY